MNRLGFGLVEIMVVMLLVGIVLFFAMEDFEKKESLHDRETAQQDRERLEALSVEGYARAIKDTATMYQIMNPEVSNIIISVDGNENNNCHIDATKEAREKTSTTCGQKDAKAVVYAGSLVSCQGASYNIQTGAATVTNCRVGDSTNTYNWSTDSQLGARKN